MVGLYMGPFRTVYLNDYDLICEAFNADTVVNRPDYDGVRYMRGGQQQDDSIPGLIMSNGHTWSEQRRFALCLTAALY